MRAALLALCTVLVSARAAAQDEAEPPEPEKEPAEPEKEPEKEPAKEPAKQPEEEPATEAEPTPKPTKPAEPKRDPDEGIARPEAEDLRGLHPLIDLGAGVWVPSSGFVPVLSGLGSPPVGVTANGDLALGLNRYIVLELQGGFAWAPGDCDGCKAMSVVGGAAIAYHLAQGFAFDPWASFGVAYRHGFATYDGDAVAETVTATDTDYSALDFARFGLGGTFFPVAVFGFGPYAALDVGVRDFSDPVYYVVFHTGLQVSFDPLNAGTTAAPNLGAR